MHSDYTEWTMDVLWRVKKDLLKTLEYIHDNKSRNDGKCYSSSELDDVEHCVSMIDKIRCMKKHLMESSEMTRTPHVVPHTKHI